MASIKSLQSDIDDLSKKAQSARDEAERLRASAANYTANGYPDKAESETNVALQRDNEAADYAQKVSETQDQLQDLEAQANAIRQSILDQQQQLTAITGESLGSWL